MKSKTLLWTLMFLLCVGAASAALTDDLWAYYALEGTGHATDSHNSNDISEVGTVAEVAGMNNNARNDFSDGSNNCFYEAITPIFSNGYSVSMWIRQDGTPPAGTHQSWTSTGGGAAMSVIPEWDLTLSRPASWGQLQGGGGKNLDSGITFANGAWYHVVVTLNATDKAYRLYVNGTQLDSDTLGNSITAIAYFNIGADGSGCGNAAQNFTLDEIAVWNRTVTPAEVTSIYNSGSGCFYSDWASECAVSTTDVHFNISDDFNSTGINNFTVDITWVNGTTQTESTSNGTVSLINVTYQQDTTLNVTYYGMTDYFNRTLLNQAITANTSNTVTTTTYQAYACFNATERISESYITPDNITIGSTVRTQCFNITASTHNAMASLLNYDTKNQTFTIPALSNATYTIANMSYNTLTVYAQDITTGAYLSGYQLNLTSLNHTGWSGDHYASTTNQTFDLINGTYNILIDMTGYALTDSEANVSVTGDGNYTFQLYPTNSLNITFLDEDDGSTLSGPNITFEIILDDSNASVGWTTNGTYWIDSLSAGDYEIRYRATDSGYGERSYYFTLTNRTYSALSLYLLNDTSTESITTTLYDEYGNTLEGYVIRLLRYYASQNGYVVVDEGQTNSEGQTVVSAIRNGPYYKFRIVDPDGDVLKTTSATQIYDTSISLYVTLGEGIGQQLENLNDISYELVWLNGSSQFRFTWDAASGLLVSVTTYVYEVDALDGDTLYNSTTSASASGTIYVGVARTNDTTYKAMSYVTFTGDSEATLLDTLTVTFDEPVATFGKLGLFLTFIIVVTFALTGLINPAAPCILVPVAMIITRIARLHALEWTWIVAITAVGAIILYVIRDKT